MTFQINLNESDLKYFSKKFASCIHNLPFILLLRGDLGAGKTTFTKYLIQSLTDDKTSVTSPTFNLVNIYDSSLGQIWHADLYRLKNPFELEETGLLEALYTHICIVEWPEILETYLPLEFLDLSIEIKDDGSRLFNFTAQGNFYESFLTKLS